MIRRVICSSRWIFTDEDNNMHYKFSRNKEKKKEKLFFPRNDGTFQRNHDMDESHIKLKE